MTPDRALIDELEKDLRLSPTGKVLYLEGHTDVPVFLGLLGRLLPETIESEGLAVDGVWIRGLGVGRGSGGRAVRTRVRVAHERGYGPIRGLIDGDGEAHDALIVGFDEPGAGEPHRWPTYCIENWLPQCGWPPEWGDEPDWPRVLGAYVPYAARLGGAEAPPLGTDLLVAFDAEVERCTVALANSLAHGHALINGKWLVDHHARVVSGRSREDCRRVWSEHAARMGGHARVRAWWASFVSR